MRDKFFIQKHSLTAAYIGFPIFVLLRHGAPPSFLIGICGLLLVIFCWAMIATLISGVAFGAGYIPYERKTRPKQFWLVVGSQIFLLCCVVYAIILSVQHLKAVA
jgi:hypothetical protein